MKVRGRGCRGRACRAVVRVARRVGGRGEPVRGGGWLVGLVWFGVGIEFEFGGGR